MVRKALVLSVVVAVALLSTGCPRARKLEDPVAKRRARCQAAWRDHVPPPGYRGDPAGTPYVEECVRRSDGEFFSPQAWERECLLDRECASRFGITSRTEREGSGRGGGQRGPGGEEPSPTSEQPVPTPDQPDPSPQPPDAGP